MLPDSLVCKPFPQASHAIFLPLLPHPQKNCLCICFTIAIFILKKTYKIVGAKK